MNDESANYEYVRAIVDCGELRWEYKVEDASVPGRMTHDEDVTDYSDDDIRDITRMMLDCPDSQEIEVLYY